MRVMLIAVIAAFVLLSSQAFARGPVPIDLAQIAAQEPVITGHSRHHHSHNSIPYSAPVYAGPTGGSDLAAVALAKVGQGNNTGKSGAWCKYFVNMIASTLGYRTTPSGMASAAAGMGPPTVPHRNAIAWNYRHTCIVLDVHGNSLTCVSGNGRNRRVSVSHYAVGQFQYVEPVHI